MKCLTGTGAWICFLALAGTFAGCGGGGGGGESTQTYHLVEGSKISTVVGHDRPELTRALSGEMRVIVSRGPDEISLQVLDVNLLSDDGTYEVRSGSGGEILIRRGEAIDAAVSLSVNGADEAMFRGALGGESYVFFLDEDPPIISGLGIRNDSRAFADRGRVTFSLVINATIDGRPIATRTPEGLSTPVIRTRKPTEIR